MPDRRRLAELFANTLVDMACEIFPEHGITEMADEDWEALMVGIAHEVFDVTVLDLAALYMSMRRDDEFLVRILRRGGKL